MKEPRIGLDRADLRWAKGEGAEPMRRVMAFMLAGVFSLALVSKAWTGPDLRRAIAAVSGMEAEG